MIGGLLLATGLTLLAVPVLYTLLANLGQVRLRAPRATARATATASGPTAASATEGP